MSSLSALKSRVDGVFSSILIFCPNFPAAAQTNVAKKFEQLNGIINAVLEKMRRDDAKQWLRMCLQEVQQSRKHYEDGDRDKGRELIQRAEEHFKNAFNRKVTAARFFVDDLGAIRDEEAGFPEQE